MLDKLAFCIIFLWESHWAAGKKRMTRIRFKVRRPEYQRRHQSEKPALKETAVCHHHTCNSESTGRKSRMQTATSNCHCSEPNQSPEAAHQKFQLLSPSCRNSKLEPRNQIQIRALGSNATWRVQGMENRGGQEEDYS